MADFIAVIRRAVDGLSNNTPEMRTKVYDKARGAVLRQLENMNPRPPEEMIRRQMDKLETAILEVEAEHREALPAEAAAPHPQESAAPVYNVPQAAAPEPEPQVEPEPEPYRPDPAPAPVVDELMAAPERRIPLPFEPPPYSSGSSELPPPPAMPAAPYEDYTVTRAEREAPARAAEPVSEQLIDTTPTPLYPEEPPFVTPVSAPHAPWEEPRREEELVQAAHGQESQDDHAPVEEEPPFAADRGRESFDRTAAFDEAPDYGPERHEPSSFEPAAAPLVAQARDVSFSTFSPSGELQPAEEIPAQSDTEREYEAWASLSAPGLDDGLHRGSAANAAAAAGARTRPGPSFDVDDEIDPIGNGYSTVPAGETRDWHSELASLPPLSGATAAAPAPAIPHPPAQARGEQPVRQTADAHGPVPRVEEFSADIEDFLANAQQKAYRPEPKPKRNFLPLILSVVGLLLLGGGGYAIWANSDAMTNLISGLTGPADPEAETAPQSTAETSAPAATAPASTTPGAAPATTTPPASQTAAAGTTGAAPTPPADGGASGQKFTQRLLADGTESNPGLGEPGTTPAGGQSVAQQNIAPGPQTPAAGSAASGTQTPGPQAAAPQDPAAVVGGQRAFLYEERLGQSSPTAIVGNVTWSAIQETGANGQPDPAIQGRLSIPDLKLSALITFRRNGDSSLPASHLVEIVFSLPPNFEGGGIDSVQRVAMKATEQDRGDPLVGVGAKVTDDTFLIALNDFPDVVARNLELMRSRNWIDVPLTYRNGRRALLTLDKGQRGNGIFDQVMKEWAALGAKTGG